MGIERTDKMAAKWFRGAQTLLLLTGFGLAGLSAADTLSLYVDNDSRLLKPNHNTDRHYTSGVKLVYGFTPDWQWLEDYGDLDVPFFSAPEGPVHTAAGFFAGHHIYTPDWADKPEKRRPKDMRFAGWLYTGLFAQRANERIMDQTELNIGVIGPSAKGRQLQNCIHNLLDSGKPIGWDTQLSDRPAVNFSWTRKERLNGPLLKPTENVDFLSEYGFTAGSVFCHLQAGLVGRLGIFGLPKDWGPDRLELPSGAIQRAYQDNGGYLFCRISGKAVGYNQFLTGLDPEPVVGQLQVGCVIQWKSLEVGYSQTFFTQEYKEQNAFDSYGALTVKWTF